jgi:hypothetical protein
MISTKEYIDQAHNRVKQLLAEGLAEEEIISTLTKEGMTAYYVQSLIDNVQNDRADKKAFWKLVAAGLLSLAAFAFVWLYPGFNGFRGGWIYYFLLFASLGGGITLLFRAFSLFRR